MPWSISSGRPATPQRRSAGPVPGTAPSTSPSGAGRSAMPTSTVTVDVQLTGEEWSAAMAEDCVAGLTSSPKHLSPVWFYDTGAASSSTRSPGCRSTADV